MGRRGTVVLAATAFWVSCFVPTPEFGAKCAIDDDCGDGRVCVGGQCLQGGWCSPENDEGLCRGGATCQCGVCAVERYGCCLCEVNEGCLAGVCVELTIATRCGNMNLTGVCAGQESCVAGACVPLDPLDLCAPDNPRGDCPVGATCDDGVCVAVVERPCTAEDPDGLCPQGQRCQPPCALVECSTAEPGGYCQDGWYCRRGECVEVPCGPLHLEGACNEPTEFCSHVGVCIAEGTCRVDQDCPYMSLCSCAADHGECLPVWECRCDEDCNQTLEEVCDQATSTCERTRACESNANCTTSEYCGTRGTCLYDGSCEVTADCQVGGGDDICSAMGECLPAGRCYEDVDCGASQFCGCIDRWHPLGRCVDEGACICDEDCLPGRSCWGGTCEVTAATCDANGPMACLGGYWCCEPEETCCPQGHRCSLPDGLCIVSDQCLNDADCPTGFVCEEYACAPLEPCDWQPICDPGEFCSWAGGCVSSDACASDGDCSSHDTCNAVFQCEPAEACLSHLIPTPLDPPGTCTSMLPWFGTGCYLRLGVYLDHHDALAPKPIMEYIDWLYDDVLEQVTFLGAACDLVAIGAASAVVVGWCVCGEG